MAVLYHAELEERNMKLVKDREISYAERMKNPKQIAEFMRQEFKLERMAEEYVYMLAFDGANHLLGVFEISHGSVNSAYLTPREIFIRALLCSAVYIAIIHNHPSNSIYPSRADREVCERIKEAGNIMGISLLDFIILGVENHYSFVEEEKLLES